jgi:hypothetical protein
MALAQPQNEMHPTNSNAASAGNTDGGWHSDNRMLVKAGERSETSYGFKDRRSVPCRQGGTWLVLVRSLQWRA